jgi:hypothetical protein
MMIKTIQRFCAFSYLFNSNSPTWNPGRAYFIIKLILISLVFIQLKYNYKRTFLFNRTLRKFTPSLIVAYQPVRYLRCSPPDIFIYQIIAIILALE